MALDVRPGVGAHPDPMKAPHRGRAGLAEHAAAALLVGLVAGGCLDATRIPPPEDLEGLVRYLWREFEAADDASLTAASTTGAALIEGLLVDGKSRVGGLSSLDVGDIAVIEWETPRDPAEAPGVFLANRFRCDLSVLAEVLTHPDQSLLHEGVYDSYERNFAGSRADWLEGAGDRLSWEVTYEATPTATQYRAQTRSTMRRLPGAPAEGALAGLLQRTYLVRPATFVGSPENHAFDQDYQVELFVDDGTGQVLHLYGLWRSMQLGLVGVEDDVFIEFQLNGLVQWDDQTEAACADWPAALSQ